MMRCRQRRGNYNLLKKSLALICFLIITINSAVHSDSSDEIINNIVGFEVIRVNSNPLFKDRVYITEEYHISIHPFAGAYYFHEGTDYARGVGTEIFAPLDGRVKEVLSNALNGNVLIIQHTDRLKTEYRHLNTILIDCGKVKKDQKIALMGSSGITTGSNLDFRVIIDDIYYNPELFFGLIDLFEINEIDKIQKYLNVDRRIKEFINFHELYFSNSPASFADEKVIYEENSIKNLNNKLFQLSTTDFPNKDFTEGYI
ncbi:MAG: M23 family metallopeptidase, partial [Eubacteriales bacterium]